MALPCLGGRSFNPKKLCNPLHKISARVCYKRSREKSLRAQERAGSFIHIYEQSRQNIMKQWKGKMTRAVLSVKPKLVFAAANSVKMSN
jgi:hypothetical protein